MPAPIAQESESHSNHHQPETSKPLVQEGGNIQTIELQGLIISRDKSKH
jgi:hypothetical protein